jgi:protease-4
MSGQNWLRGRTIVHNPTPRVGKAPSSRRWNPFRILWEALKRTAMLMGFVMLFTMALGAWSASQMVTEKKPSLPKDMVLLLDMTGEVNGQSKSLRYLEEFGLSSSSQLTVPGMVDAIDNGAKDDKVKALALFLGSGAFEVTDFQEIREAILRFRSTGKPVSAYADSFGGGGSGLGMYYLASAANDIWMQPVGVVAIPGLSIELPFFRKLMEKYGVKPQFFQRKEYKTAMESFTSSGMSPESREQMEGLVKDLGDQFVGAIAAGRPQVSKTFRALIDQGLFTDEEALNLGLIDHIDYRDVFIASLRSKIGGDPEARLPNVITLEQYATVPYAKPAKLPMVARITIEGMISEDAGGRGYGFQQRPATSGEIALAIMSAAEDKNVKAILLRVNSPGGTPTAAETIHRAITRAQTIHKKPVIVSMGNMAASGGYWISAPADRIYALPATLTGSIGVVGGKFDVSGLFEKLDVNWEEVSYGRNGGMWSMNGSFSPSEQERFENSLDNVYTYFLKRVSDGRKLSPAQAESVAKGHVWTGRQAKELGLVDALGGEDLALDDLAKKFGKESRMNLNVVDLPKPKSKLEALMSLLSTEVSLSGFIPQRVLEQIEPLLVKTDGRMIYQERPVINP